MEEMKENYEGMSKELSEEKSKREALEKEYKQALNARNKLKEQQSGDATAIPQLESQYFSLLETKQELADKYQELQERLEDEEEINIDIIAKKKKLKVFTEEQSSLRDALKLKFVRNEEDRGKMAIQLRDQEEKAHTLKVLMDELERDCLHLEEKRFMTIKVLQDQEAKIATLNLHCTRIKDQVDSAQLDYETELGF